MGYSEDYKSWQNDPEAFWMAQAAPIDWVTPPSRALFADNAPLYELFKDTQVNTCSNSVTPMLDWLAGTVSQSGT